MATLEKATRFGNGKQGQRDLSVESLSHRLEVWVNDLIDSDLTAMQIVQITGKHGVQIVPVQVENIIVRRHQRAHGA